MQKNNKEKVVVEKQMKKKQKKRRKVQYLDFYSLVNMKLNWKI